MMEYCANCVSATVGVCPRQWGYVCNSGGMSATVGVCSREVQLIRFAGLSLIMTLIYCEYSTANIGGCLYLTGILKLCRFIRDSGGMSATVGLCSLEVKTMKK